MKNYVLGLFLTISPFFVIAQTVSGKIIDNTEELIVGAYVIHDYSGNYTYSDEFGSFSLNNVAQGDTLEVLHLGFENKKVLVESIGSELEIKLAPSIFQLDDVQVNQSTKATNILSFLDLKANPVNSSQEILAIVPGLFIGQHAGGGKAEQLFLRGFDIDHGTDVQISVDGLPVNMVSHAHGQGYADLHFLIPETVDFIDFGKGPYFANKGNFNTAGYVDMRTKDRLDNSSIGIEIGRFNTIRSLAMINLLPKIKKHHAYIATEYLSSDGPFESSQNFRRTNLMGKYSGNINAQDHLSITTSYFSSQWDASGQIPTRAVDSGLISRFGAIDDTEGGNTSRMNIAVAFDRSLTDNTYIKNKLYYSLYDFQLFSNFTFFLDDPINQDQIMQQEKRQLFGLESSINKTIFLDNANITWKGGIGLRQDNSTNNRLAHTKNRTTILENIQLGDVDETNVYAFASADINMGNWVLQPGLRLDYFNFGYQNQLISSLPYQSQSKVMLNPKFNVIYNHSSSIQFFLKTGSGFNTNDSRVVLNQSAEKVLPRAYGVDLGTLWKPAKRLIIDAAAWYLFLEQEFVYIGDAGIVEPSGETQRIGLDIGLRYQLTDWLFANSDFNYAHARSLDNNNENNLIPLAPVFTGAGGLSWQHNNFTGAIRYRYMHDRPATENNSIVAKGYYIMDLNANYEWKSLTLGFAIENLLNQEWNETQFATLSRLDFEQEPVEEIHFTPGTPFFLKAKMTYSF